MKAKKPLLLAVLILAVLAVVLILPPAVSGGDVTNVDFVAFHYCPPTTPEPPAYETGAAVHWRDWLYQGVYFGAPYSTDPCWNPTDVSLYPELLPLCGYGYEYVSMDQTNIRGQGTVTVVNAPYAGSIWEWSSVSPLSDPITGSITYHVTGRGVFGEVKGWVLSYDVTIEFGPPPVATASGYYIMK